jgi:hypothetical protein
MFFSQFYVMIQIDAWHITALEGAAKQQLAASSAMAIQVAFH